MTEEKLIGKPYGWGRPWAMVQWLRGNPSVEAPKLDWPCLCVACGFNYIWVVRVGFVLQSVEAFDSKEIVIDKDSGTPIFLFRGREEKNLYRYGPDWTDDISKAKHFLNHEDAEGAMAEALILHPSLIGRADSVQFRIR